MIVTGFRVKLSTVIVIAVTNKRCVKNEVLGHVFIYLPFWDILSCHRVQRCKEIRKLRQAENKEETRVDQRRQQWPNHSCLACIAELRQCRAGWQVLGSEAALKSAHPEACLQYLLLAEISSIANRA